jgi:hypothetical protein
MPFPCICVNTETGNTFNVTKSAVAKNFQGFMIKATESYWMPFVTLQWGSVDWEIDGTDFLLHTIESHPEKGTGLGSLMMYLAAKEALLANSTRMQILNAAMTERGFYAQMGCAVDPTAMANFNQADFSQNDWAKLESSCPVVGDPGNVLAMSLNSVIKRWTFPH